ncbi:MAG: Flp family type IVb pilin [Alphaproteobacteria bacterium]|nr:Flp family type IVb pilin [Alphaproteobacteria bacterium]
MSKILKSLLADRTGATTIEYGLVGALLSVAIIAAISQVGETSGEVFKVVAAHIEGAKNCTPGGSGSGGGGSGGGSGTGCKGGGGGGGGDGSGGGGGGGGSGGGGSQ